MEGLSLKSNVVWFEARSHLEVSKSVTMEESSTISRLTGSFSFLSETSPFESLSFRTSWLCPHSGLQNLQGGRGTLFRIGLIRGTEVDLSLSAVEEEVRQSPLEHEVVDSGFELVGEVFFLDPLEPLFLDDKASFNVPTFSCGLCENSFMTEWQVANHQQVHEHPQKLVSFSIYSSTAKGWNCKMTWILTWSLKLLNYLVPFSQLSQYQLIPW